KRFVHSIDRKAIEQGRASRADQKIPTHDASGRSGMLIHDVHLSPCRTVSVYRKGEKARLDSLAYLPLHDINVIDLDTAKTLTPSKEMNVTVVRLDVPIVDDKQSAHVKITGAVRDGTYRLENGDLVFERTLHGLRNTVLLPDG